MHFTRQKSNNLFLEWCIFDSISKILSCMQRVLIILFPFLILLGFSSCDGETESTDINFENNPLKNRSLIHSFSNEVHLIELYARDTVLYEGYNDLLLRIKDKNDTYISYAEVEWEITTNDSIAGPITNIDRSIDNPDVYTSFLIFPKNTYSSDWSLNVAYQIQSTTYEASTDLIVHEPNEYRITLKEEIGTDNKDYLIALSEPYKPINGYNNCSLLIYEKKSPTDYEIRRDLNVNVWFSKEDYIHDVVIELPFRPNSDKYQGKVEIIDLGVWQLNVVIQNVQSEILLGDKKSTDHPTSSLHFPLLTDSFTND